MYSRDRQEALEATLSCLRDMPLYDQCQKTVIADGRINYRPEDCLIVEVPQLGDFCWSYMWDAGVLTARFPIVLYLDSDRLWPKNFLQEVAHKTKDGVFLFTTNHFQMLEKMPIDICKHFLAMFAENQEILAQRPYLASLKFDPRYGQCLHGPGKNVMSGGTAFTKKTFLELGGVDPWYRGHGAYADTDFHFIAQMAGCKFIDLGLPELHWPHPKLDDKDAVLSQNDLRKLAFDNYLYYCTKWGLPSVLLENMAHEMGLHRPDQYITKRKKEFGI